jgi:type III pantothenate kinase
VVDVGNSETVVGVMEGREVRHSWRLTSSRMTADEAALRAGELLATIGLASTPFRGAVLCSVAPALTPPWLEALARRSGTPPVEVSAATVPHLAIRYHDRMSVGADRIANAIAARALYGTPAIVVDLGTATTFDCVSQPGAYLGGVIAPGMMTSAEELFRRAARIPRVELRRPSRALGRNTEEALWAASLGHRGTGRRAGAPTRARDEGHTARDRHRRAGEPDRSGMRDHQPRRRVADAQGHGPDLGGELVSRSVTIGTLALLASIAA